jgi:hypothetical protein
MVLLSDGFDTAHLRYNNQEGTGMDKVENKRYYVSERSHTIVEYPSRTIHTPSETTLYDESCSVKALPEHEAAHMRSIFILDPLIAEAAIAHWESKRPKFTSTPHDDKSQFWPVTD